MKAANAKHKGSAFESRIMRQLREIYPDAHRSMGSGCSNVADDKGDVVAGRFMVECKHHAHFTRNELNKYWLKIVEEAAAAKKEPLLVFKENRCDDMVMLFVNDDSCMCDDRRMLMYWDEFVDAISEEREIRGGWESTY